ncbi:MAG TPA: shikimate dehydrogenase [Thermoleophilaceae bacterium]|nr:shikimate dehydrogenase [Thermoleophilaceae bacterium]
MGRTLLGVAGWPVAHSRSPAMFAPALAELGLDWRYVHLPLPPERFVETARALAASGYRGINVTMPHKRAAHDLADELSAAAAAIGAANTLTYADGRIEADNTDAGGFLDALGADPAGWRCLLLGAGGSARAVAWALREAGAGEVSIWNRTPDRAAALARDLDLRHVEAPESAELIVNCTSVGIDQAIGEQEAVAAVGLTGVDPPPTFFDLTYGAATTPLARWASAGGARVVEGLEMLVRQGARSLERWTGQPAPLEAMRAGARGGEPA